ncbi:dihydropyrimidinase [Hydrogenoanaerobacterium sp.]|uniref:dihydropyrimidinase n=1 Tax=Hydrogenoanaerobacterium sp. TaxID=2953763 RepID=UPI0028A1EF02|nr:dihydropyrimidinase [Hydrogenoanaerobacterium sp.]
MSKIIKGGTIVTPKGSFAADLRIEDNKIAEIAEQLPADGAEVLDATGCLLFPGFIDAHTHFDMSTGTALTADNFHSGTRGAIVGGTTTIVDFATQEKGETLVQALKNWHAKADGVSSCDYAFHMAISDWNPSVRNEIDTMVAEGVTSFKLYLAYDNLRVSDGELYEILKCVRDVHGIIGVHCENGDLVNEMIAEKRAAGELTPAAHPASRPDFVEAEAVSRYLYIAEASDAPVNIVHLSTKLGFDEVLKARAKGQKVYVETCPHYLMLDESRYNLENFESAKYVCSPPLRKKEDQQCLWTALKNNDIDTVSTDHCSFNFKKQKEQGRDDFSKIPNGMPGVEHRPAVMYTYGVCENRITKEQMAAQLSENTARLFGMYPQKGAMLAGSDADIVVWDPSFKGTITAQHMQQNVDYTPYEGLAVTGRPKAVFLRGQQVVQDGEVIAEHCGAYVHRHESEYYPQHG